MDASSGRHHVGDIAKSPQTGAEVRLILIVCVATIPLLLATAIWPDIDVAIARHVLLPLSSPLRPSALILREILRFTPWVLCAALSIYFLLRAARGQTPPRRAARQLIFFLGLAAVGPGLLVNAGLKEHSHRPRPIQTIEVAGGAMPFRPYYRFDGGCARNCSFSSGEAASSFWTVAPALLTPPPLRTAAVAAALAFGVGASTMRMVVGAHFLSDVAFSALLILLLTLAVRRVIRPD